MKHVFYLLLASSLFLFACGEDDSIPTDADKGAEDSPLTDGKSDSFFRPTDHGPASFTNANAATIDDDHTFHSWSFQLDGEATVDLRIEIDTPNLDTVMYLYHRENEEDNWGRYLKKNDDHDRQIWSRIQGDLEAGYYRVIIKAYKFSMRGSFSLHASCDGDGCATADGGECTPGDYTALPSETGYGDDCANSILDVIGSELQSESQLEIPEAEKCDLMSPLATKAVDYYVSYWNDVVGFEELFGTDVRLNVEEYTYARGTVFEIDANADEDRMRLVFDADGELLALYQDNQSPDNRFYCGQTNDLMADFPACWNDSVTTLRRTSTDTSIDEDTTTVDEANASDELDSDLIHAVLHFSETNDIGNQEEIAYQLTRWEDSYTSGAKLLLTTGTGDMSAGNVSARYWIGNNEWTGKNELLAVSDPDGTRYLCESVE